MARVLVVNPNSSTVVTGSIRAALAPLGRHFDVVDVPDGPATISTAEDVARAGLAFAEMVARTPAADAYVSACFSDPGVEIARGLTTKPVVGIQEAGIYAALAQVEFFGILALSQQAIARHRRRMRAMGVLPRMAGELSLPDVSAEASGCGDIVFDVAREKILALSAMGAEAVVLGCSGMSPLRGRLETETGVRVVDPVFAAGALSLGSLLV